MERTDLAQHEETDVAVRIGDTDVGKGVFVTRDFVAGEQILGFRGSVIDFAAALAKGAHECDAFQIGPGAYLDLEPPCLIHVGTEGPASEGVNPCPPIARPGRAR